MNKSTLLMIGAVAILIGSLCIMASVVRNAALYPSSSISQLAAISGASSGLVAHWALDEGSGSTAGDSSGNGRTGSLSGGATWTTGKIGQAVLLNGSSGFVDIPGGTVSAYPFTLSAWVNGSSGTIISLANNTNNSQYARIAISNGSALIGVRDSAGNETTTSGGSNLSSSWHHVVGVFASANDRRLYVNGVLVGTSGVSRPNFFANRTAVGRVSRENVMGYFSGAIDDARIYNRVLSVSEINDLYNVGVSGGSVSLAALSESNGNTSTESLAVSGNQTLTTSTAPSVSDSTCTSITQYGITWTFDKAYTCGTFANGDWWVLGPTVITRITPDFDGRSNGWEVNPVVSGGQGFQDGCYGGGFSAALIPALPYTAQGGQSLVKTIGLTSSNPCIKTASVLTVVSGIPPGNGVGVFRPPYVGTNKPYYYVSQLQTQLLPAYAPVASMPTLQWVTNRFSKVQLDHKSGGLGRALHPLDHMPDYGADIGKDNADALLRLMMNDSVSAKMPALIQYVQFGIDQYWTIQNGQTWPDGGGHRPGHRAPVAFTAVMLGDQSMKNMLSAATFFHEDSSIVQQSPDGVWLYGDSAADEASYWKTVETDTGYRSRVDPYKFIDGGPYPAGPYQTCCTSQPWMGSVLGAHLMPQLKTAWNPTEFTQISSYIDRWMNFGAWAQPDPCAPLSQGGGRNPAGGCILDPDLVPGSTMQNFSCQPGKQCGRFPERHGISKAGGGRGTAFQKNMWSTYRAAAGSVSAVPLAPNTGVAEGSVPQGNASTKFSVGSGVQVSSGPLTVRSTAAGNSLGQQVVGSTGTVVGGPAYASLSGVNYHWWNIDFASGVDGWVVEDFLSSHSVTTLAPEPVSQAPAPAQGSTLTVKKDGTGNFTTIQACLTAAQAGQTCLVGPGTYTESLEFPRPGTAGNMVKLQAQHSWGHDTQLNRTVIVGGITLKSYNGMYGFEVVNNGVRIDGSNVEIVSNLIHGIGDGSAGTAIGFTRPNPYHSDVLIRDNHLRQMSYGILMFCSDRCLAENNKIEKLFTRPECRPSGACAGDVDYIRIFGNGITLRGNKLHGSIRSEIDADAHVDGIQSFNNGGLGGQGRDTLTNVIIEGNWIQDAHQAIWWTSVSATFNGVPMMSNNITIRNNIFRNTWGTSARMALGGPNTDNIYVYNNIFGQSVRITAKTRTVVKNNIFLGNYMNTDSDSFSWPRLSYEMTNNILDSEGSWLNRSTATKYPTLFSSFSNIHSTSGSSALFANSSVADFRPKAGSVGIGAGVNLSSTGFSNDKDGNIRSATGPWDIGAYRATSGAYSPPPVTSQPSQPTLPPAFQVGDFNRDGVVNTLDFTMMRARWNTADSIYDLNGDGVVNSVDASILLKNF